MLIAQDDSAFNNAESQTNTISISGNIILSNWYHRLLRTCNKPDTVAITILSELVSLFLLALPKFQLKFLYFKRKFNFGLSQVKDDIVRLEKITIQSILNCTFSITHFFYICTPIIILLLLYIVN
jgi:hypothetical protein